MTQDRIVRCIGVDFGTSTSAVFYKDFHEDGSPLRKADEGTPVKFELKHTTVPTLILDAPSGKTSFGHEAERRARNNPDGLEQGFKVDLVSEDAGTRERAAELTERFFRYLYEEYRSQSTVPQGVKLEEKTLVSYPAKWPQAAREATVEAAQKAGFQNVEGMEEPSAAMLYFLNVRTAAVEDAMGRLREAGVLVEGRPITALLIDMGAGTTDFVLYRYTPGTDEYESLPPVWPPVGREGFGGREVDRLLWERVLDPVVRSGTEALGLPYEAFAKRFERTARPWKEEEVSPTLRDGGRVEALPPDFSLMAGTGSELDLDRERFEKELAEYLSAFPKLLRELVEHAVEEGSVASGKDVDLVILTGGHSQWYFVKEMLLGRSEIGPGAVLGRVRREPYRIVQGPHPQETVARGLALAGTVDPQRSATAMARTQERSRERISHLSEATKVAEQDVKQDSEVHPYKLLHTLGEDTYHIKSVAYAPDGNAIASSHWGKINLWDSQTGTLLRTFTLGHGSVNSVAFSPDGRYLAGSIETSEYVPKKGLFSTAKTHYHQHVKLFDVHSGDVLHTLYVYAHEDRQLSSFLPVTFSPDSTFIACGRSCRVGYADNVAIRSVQTGEHLYDLAKSYGDVSSLAFSPDGKTIAASMGFHGCKLWDANSGKLLRTFADRNSKHSSIPGSVAFSPDSRSIVSSTRGGTLYLWDRESNKMLRKLAEHEENGVESVSFSPDGSFVASGGSSFSGGPPPTIKLWDVHSGKLLNTLAGHKGRITSVTFNSDGGSIASSSWDGTIKIWERA